MKTISLLTVLTCLSLAVNAQSPTLFPAPDAEGVNVDTHLRITFPEDVQVGTKGLIRVYDLTTKREVDRLDISIPAGPTKPQPSNPAAIYTPVPYDYSATGISNRNTRPGTPSGAAAAASDLGRYQLTIIGGFSDGFHFHPIIAHGPTATIYLHNNLLDYGHRYRVTIDKTVFPQAGRLQWTFTTKPFSPASSSKRITVAADGSGDFSTVQGALDFVEDRLSGEDQRVTIFVRNGDYEELVYFRNKSFVTIEGESRDGVRIHYPNNEVFNPHPADIKTNELKGTFPSRRAAFAADNCTDMIFRNLTLQTDLQGQAEGFLLNGERNYVENVHIIGSGDALQTNGSAYYHNCTIDGGGDTVLGRGPTFFNHCTLSSWGPFMWIRNTEENHGNIFVDCHFIGKGRDAVIARLPDNHGKNYPHAEVVMLNCTLEGVPAVGFGPIDESARTATLLEFNSTDPSGRPLDVSQRHPLVRQLHPLQDAATIANYSDSRFVLKMK
ncbi:MAG: carbohydrate esterase [Prevotella sp.]|nr:carbohydrate esterase [Prevotella sp.]